MGNFRNRHGHPEESTIPATDSINLLELAQKGPSEPSSELDGVRQKLATRRGFWRNFDEVLDNAKHRLHVEDEFPERASLLQIDRRDFMKFMGASAVMAAVAGCRQLPEEKIVPYVKAPEEFVPGKPIYYATTFVHAGYGAGVLALSHMGRPTKLEGNPDHPASLGSTDAYTQAAIWGLYDPDRSQQIETGKDIGTWEAFFTKIREAAKANPGGFRILAESTSSPSLQAMLDQVVAKFPGSKVYTYDPGLRENAIEGSRLAFGEAVDPVYDFSKAKVIVTLDADPFAELPGGVRYARDFSERRRPDAEGGMVRIYSIESYPTLIGSLADHRVAVKPSKVEEGARALATAVGAGGDGGFSFAEAPWLTALVEELNQNKGASIVLAGRGQSPAVHALAYGINEALGNVGNTVHYIPSVVGGGALPTESLKSLIQEMNAGSVSTLLILGGNPAFSAPAELGFADALAKVPLKAHWGLYNDETAALCDWHVPATHFLEEWGDARAYDGTVSLIQPLISPLYSGRPAIEVLEGLLGGARKSRELVREYWKGGAGRPTVLADDVKWQEALEKGVVPGTATAPKAVTYRKDAIPAADSAGGGIETLFLPDPGVFDGRYANCPWLQEMQKPFTSLTWDNTVQLSPRTASAQGLENHDVVEIELGGRKVEGPVWVVPGMADDTVVIHLGYGRAKSGMIGTGPGFDANKIRPATVAGAAAGISLKKIGANFHLAPVHGHHQQEGRDIVRVGNLADMAANPNFAPPNAYKKDETIERNLYTPEEFAYDGYKWALTVDLNTCIGCNACVIACQTENNIPCVGKEQVIRERELHWIRIDRYYNGGLDSPEEIVHQPVICMHCEQAPCEPVCPVAATTHSKEGLNQMVYNRCVGTRYCSNNCPYKVRRFNYINYGDRTDYPSTQDKKKPAPTLRLLQNPNVTVRGRGVMEKCTYCVQRINAARIEAKKADRPIKDGEIVPACAQACPTKTITFGSIHDPNSAVSKTRADGRNYSLLEELNTVPRTTYLAKVKNPNPNA